MRRIWPRLDIFQEAGRRKATTASGYYVGTQKADSDAGWEACAASEACASHEAKFASVLTCGDEVGVNRFGFNSFIPQPVPETFTGDPAPYYLTNMFFFNEGKGPADLRAWGTDSYLPMLSEGAEENPESSYWFMVGGPDFEVNEENPFDFNWLNYQTAEEGEAASAAFAHQRKARCRRLSMRWRHVRILNLGTVI